MSKPHMTSVSNLPSWLTMAAHIYPPQQVVLVGAGNGTGPLVQWLQSWATDTGQGLPALTLLEPHTLSRAQLSKRLAGIEACANWLFLPDMLAPELGDQTYHQYTLAAENGLLPPEALHPLWPSLQLLGQQPAAGVPLASLLPANWLLLDCLPAAHLLQGTCLPTSTQVVLARVVLSDAAPAGSSLASVQALLAPSGFKAVATFAERNSSLGKALFVRDPKGLQDHIDQALAKAQALEADKAQLTDAKAELQSQLEQVNQALHTEKASKQAEAHARAAEQEAKEQALAKAQALEADKAQLAEAKDKALALVQQMQQEKVQAQQRLDQSAKVKEQNQSQADAFQSEIDALKKFKDEWAETNKNPYAHNRVLTASLNSSLRDFANKNLGLQQIKPAYLDYLALKAHQVEKNCVGRLATTVQDAVTRQLVVECLTEEKALILEIGALYGVGMAILYNHAITRAQEVRLICLDPFDGYYGKAIDALLNQPVNDLTFKRNMKLANVPESDYSIVKRYSTDPLALEEVNNHAFNLLIIDGDHSYEGVKFDFEKFFPLLEKGGYVIFDDYNAREWPGVQKFIDEDLKAHANLQYLGAFSRTAVGRKLY